MNSKPKVDNDVVDKFISQIIPLGNNRFAWFVNVSGASRREVNMVIEGRKNNASIHVVKEDEKSEDDDESSVHNGMKHLKKCCSGGKEYSLVWLPHRLLSTTNNISKI